MPFAFTNPPTHLRDLSLSAVDNWDLTNALLAACGQNLVKLDVRQVGGQEGQMLIDLLKPILPRLVKFAVSDAPPRSLGIHRFVFALTRRQAYVYKALAQLTSVQELVLGLEGIVPAPLFPALVHLKHLRHFRLEQVERSGRAPMPYFPSEAFLSFLEVAPSLESVSLPQLLREDAIWFLSGMVKAEGVAKARGVSLEM